MKDTHMTLEDWIQNGKPEQTPVVVGGADALEPHYGALLTCAQIIIRFEGFMDGRGFSHAAKLRQMGYEGSLIAGGDVIADQWVYLRRCGFDGIESDATEADAGRLPGFTESYQADARQKEPLFRRERDLSS